MILKKKSNHNVVLMDYQGKWNIHLLRQPNSLKEWKITKKFGQLGERLLTFISLSLYGPFYDQVTVVTHAPNNSLFFSFSSSLKYLRQQSWGTSLFRWFKLQNIQECPGVPFFLHCFQSSLASVTQGYSHYQTRLSKTIHTTLSSGPRGV